MKGIEFTTMLTEKKAFRRIQWGLLFFIDYTAGGVDLLPDIVGLFLIYTAIRDLEGVEPPFRRAKAVVIPLMALAVIEILQPFFIQAIPRGILAWYGVGRSVLETGLNIALMALLCGGLRSFLLRNGQPALAHMARRRLIYFIVALGCSLSMIGFALASPMLFDAMAVPFFLLYIIVVIMLMGLFGQAAKRTDAMGGSMA
ncbi:MAG: hypothetical protein E6230_24175 [Paenibacillus dendritiformis]|uniref:hypothetical protein n=1 Tax=Paenibacillus dendritiformis TaxID=130049 RepID=UPI001B03E9D9|nr:hypothetical protein [Paenibacillus dendritiformis]MDU5145279.1 hypothetical protein [Paenibacillus dendritiformis]GIO70610.1 hypothetical protein J27TS7_01240 [Paenibacillus dendritiformis]